MCAAEKLRMKSSGGCSPNALTGYSSAVIAVPLGDETITEHDAMTIIMAPAVEEQWDCTPLVEVVRNTRDA